MTVCVCEIEIIETSNNLKNMKRENDIITRCFFGAK